MPRNISNLRLTQSKTDMTRRKIAEKNFVDGYSCAQAVVLAFSDVTGFEGKQALMLCSSFGGGMGRLREVCGAVSGMFIVEGLLEGYSYPDLPDAQAQKAQHYARIQELARRFKQINGAIVCRELLGARATTNPTPDARTPEYYRTRPCAKMCGDAAQVLEQFLIERGIIQQ